MKLYFHPVSPPCWAVMLVGRQLKIKFDLIEIDVLNGAQLKDDFIAVNPEHTVPTLDDDGFILGESRAILRYLVEKYGKQASDSLYPKEVSSRALVDQRLDYDLGTLYARFLAYCTPMWEQKIPAAEKDRQSVRESLGVLEKRLSNGRYAAGGEQLTIADISLICSVSSLDACYFKLDEFAGVSEWYKRCREQLVGYDEIVGKAFEIFRAEIVKPED